MFIDHNRFALSIILILCSAIFVFTSCTQPQNLTETSISESTITSETTITTVKSPISEQPQPHGNYQVSSYDELYAALTLPEDDNFQKIRREYDDVSKTYYQMLELFSSGKITMVSPKINGQTIPLEDTFGESRIGIYARDTYGLPWFFHHHMVNGTLLRVDICYLDAVDAIDYEAVSTFIDVIRIIKPDAPLPGNIEDYEGYKAADESDITLADGKTYKTVSFEYNEKKYKTYYFKQDNMIIRIEAVPELFNDAFWSSFSISSYIADIQTLNS